MYLAKISSLPTRLNVINANIQAGHPHGPANPTLGCASQDSKAVLSPKRIWPWGFRFCSTFSSAPWAEDVQGMWARLHGYWPSVMPEFQRAGVPPPKHLELPSDSPAGCKGLTWGKHCKRDRVASRSQQQQPQPRDHVNIPRMQFHPCLPAWPQRTQIHAPDHAYTEANTSTLPQWPPSLHGVTLLDSCMTNSALHSCRQVPNNVFWTKSKGLLQTGNQNEHHCLEHPQLSPS